VAVNGKPVYNLGGFCNGQPNPLHVHLAGRFHRAELINQGPLLLTLPHLCHQCFVDRGHIGQLAGHDQDGQPKLPVQIIDIDDVKSGQGNALQHHQLYMFGKPRPGH
jgi:hypothetical protein